LAQQRVVDALGAELVDHQRRAAALRRLQEALDERRSPGAEKTRDDGHRQPRAALILLPPAKLTGGCRGKQIEDGVGRHRRLLSSPSSGEGGEEAAAPLW